MKLPATGKPGQIILQELDEYKTEDVDWTSGRVFGYVFDPGPDILDFAKQAYNRFLSENALDFTVYPSLLRLENELVGLMRSHVRGDDQVVGNFSSGGTESILLAVKSARDYYRWKRPDITQPEMILPSTAHAAFHKAAHYLGLKVVSVPVNPMTFRADLQAVQKQITPQTIFMAGSAPSYTQGVIDPIAELSQLALDHEIWFHTDACMGGFLLPYWKRLGQAVPDFDFALPGVSSLSVDLHKYAYTPKGASLVLYRNSDLRRFQMFAFSKWLGYTMINPTIQSTKTGGPLAAAWAVLQYIGDAGYLEFARQKLIATQQISRGIQKIPELYLLAKPDMTLLSFASREVNIFHIIDEMNLRGWYIQPSFSFEDTPANIHLSITLSNVDKTDQFCADLKDSVARAKELPSGLLLAKAGQLLEDHGDNLLEKTDELMALAGITKGRLPKRMAGVNELLNSISPEWREKILLEVCNHFFQPQTE